MTSTSTSGLVQPIGEPPYGCSPVVTPTSTIASPAANARLPNQSMRARWRKPISRSFQKPQTVPTTPIGTLTRKIHRQLIAARTPPTMMPRNDPAMAAIMLMLRAKPRWLDGNASVMIAAPLAITIAPPTAWTMRNTISSIAPADPLLHTSDRPTAASVKIANPMLYTRVRPYMSPSRPAVTTSTAETTMYP